MSQGHRFLFSDLGVDAWLEAQVPIYGNPEQLRFVAKQGGAAAGQPFGDIALDDIFLSMQPCDRPDVTTEAVVTEKITGIHRLSYSNVSLAITIIWGNIKPKYFINIYTNKTSFFL